MTAALRVARWLSLVLVVLVSGCTHAAPAYTTVRIGSGVTAASQISPPDIGATFNDPSLRYGTATHGLAGAHVAHRTRITEGLSVGVNASVLTAFLAHVTDDTQRYGSYARRYQLVSVSGLVGFDGPRFDMEVGGSVGLGFAQGPDMPRAPNAFPNVRARLLVGRPQRARLHVQLGSDDAFLWDARLLAVGLRIPFARGHLALGPGLGARVAGFIGAGQDHGAITFATRRSTPIEVLVWAELVVRLRPSLALTLDIQGGRQLPVVQLGLSRRFAHPPAPAGPPR